MVLKQHVLSVISHCWSQYLDLAWVAMVWASAAVIMVYFIHQSDHENLIISRGDTNGSQPKIQIYSGHQYLFDDMNILLEVFIKII